METCLHRLRRSLQTLLRKEGQDLVEYALVVALIAFAATASLHTLASSINQAFSNVATKVTTTI